jgi:hypothetical protein
MNTEDLRGLIWDELFRARRPQSLEEIAARVNQDTVAIRTAVAHDWFTVDNEQVAIAMVARERRPN